ncbi:MAG: secondary thiamine-phosphate synthase enzyme [Candidatus Altiarchaeales archaeon WOR_SM1_86-2]|nr:MAG: secondary thiamine-phosphate synthase enzyme [Candidatus Altiarchaeales archaeon WOR_SM1_79]ODS37306.1 MAG: secondary thiamine-phosphate synthase enzyme [Candidatus Altiarchaeales archaeon WOR_SM1_86-2]
MAVVTKTIQVSTKRDVDLKDITSQVAGIVKKSGLKDGIATVFVPGATGSVSTIEYEPGLLKDIPKALERIAPSDIDYEHHKTWGCDNGKSHVRATFLGPGLVVPFADSKLILGTWQQIVFMDFDTKARNRKVVVQVMGE